MTTKYPLRIHDTFGPVRWIICDDELIPVATMPNGKLLRLDIPTAEFGQVFGDKSQAEEELARRRQHA